MFLYQFEDDTSNFVPISFRKFYDVFFFFSPSPTMPNVSEEKIMAIIREAVCRFLPLIINCFFLLHTTLTQNVEK